MQLFFICISTRTYPYDFQKIDIIFMLKSFVIWLSLSLLFILTL